MMRDLLIGKKNAANQCRAAEMENQIRAKRWWLNMKNEKEQQKNKTYALFVFVFKVCSIGIAPSAPKQH